MKCKICDSHTKNLFSRKILEKYDVEYHKCLNCGFIQTDDPYWLSESYASVINDIDLGPVNRAISGARISEGFLLSKFDFCGKFVDYGAGYGVLVRLMRDRGFNFYWHDPYCVNLFAKHFVAKPGMRFELLTAYEVFEHMPDPIAGIEDMLNFSSNILFSTLLVPKREENISDWWYFGPEHGQHVAFFTERALSIVAERFSLKLATDGMGLHLLSREHVSNRLFRFLARDSTAAAMVRWYLRRKMPRQSLLSEDFRMVSGHQL